MKVEIGGLKCDNELCDYNDPSVRVEDYYLHVDKGCPKCGENILTKADFDMVEKLLDAEQIINYACFDESADTQARVGLSLDGSGKLETVYEIVMPDNNKN